MTSSSSTSSSTSASSLLLSGGALALVLLVTGAATAALGHRWGGHEGMLVGISSAAICFVAGLLGLLAVYIAKQMGQALNGLLASIFFRTGLPLLAGTLLLNQLEVLPRPQAVALLTVNYLAALACETLLSVWMVGGTPLMPTAKAATAKSDGVAPSKAS
ncbi:hypothetical protein Psta_4405 [Pirellula staleyi DSM 6068]|uniref:Uncharacterized protein n=1 Tax=Pirellula staleyi (strain ATCC 27377 / DSM 6068 / ICPB 4128) TaxID=530564 RepID=D2R5W6_PIRSD|nr:hypothetical protein [Pirellula staleyi]ADB19051.1 hypothetical protein Psta_4405 [Pirellula staleyi DSM 6068]